MKDSVFKRKTTQHWLSCFQIAGKY